MKKNLFFILIYSISFLATAQSSEDFIDSMINVLNITNKNLDIFYNIEKNKEIKDSLKNAYSISINQSLYAKSLLYAIKNHDKNIFTIKNKKLYISNNNRCQMIDIVKYDSQSLMTFIINNKQKIIVKKNKILFNNKKIVKKATKKHINLLLLFSADIRRFGC
ncbi:hypothetical protein [Hugenholtzia roseola]|uniref:hypothetical protein n=1 Tax=Hugenholtzia roseola TaxID=1002 RepID=UPI00047D4BF7|nr:hypothetical protein [Hugenholtzia roseola]